MTVTPPEITTLDEVTQVAEQFGAGQFARGAASRQGEVNELTGEVGALHGVIDGMDQELADANRRIAELEAQLPPTFALGMAYRSNTDPAAVEARIGFPVDSRRTYYGASDQAAAVKHVKANIAAGRRISSISIKVPFTWAEMAAGKGDTWATGWRAGLATVIAGTDHVVKVAFNHEPENDKAPNNGGTVTGRDNWKAMQLRLAPLFDQAGFFFIVIVMGMHSTRTGDPLFKVWKLDLAIPDSPHIKGVGYDLYQFRGRVQAGKTTADGWSPQEADFKAIKAFHDTRPGLAWGLSETAHTDAAETERPGLLAATKALVVQYGGSWLEWFNSNLNSTAAWEMVAGSPREKSYAAVRAAR